MKKSKIIISLLILFIIALSIILCILNSKTELKTVSSKSELKRFYNNGTDYPIQEKLISIFTMPWSLLHNNDLKYAAGISQVTNSSRSIIDIAESALTTDSIRADASTSSASSSESSKDYSTTNIQVENVDEADITKTDGDYIYSISENNVVITNAQNPSELKIASKISPSGIPQDLILYNNKLVVISAESSTNSYNNNTIVDIYNIENKELPVKLKNYKLYEPYYTSRCINNRLYIISSGELRKEGSDIVTYYNENNNAKNINLKDIHYLKNVKSKVQTLISTMDLNNATEDVSVKSYLIDISNAYITEDSIYLLDQDYEYKYSYLPISSLFTWKGIIGPFVYESNTTTSNYSTHIYKFNINSDGLIKYDCKTKTEGKTINQFSLDEYNNNLRVALYDNNGSKVVVFNNKLEKIGETDYLAKGEKMYSSRFIGNKAYLVTYKTIDPLYVIDLSKPENPTVLGELKIPGYSTYLHPYDENHIIGIGMETKEKTYRNSFGRITSTTASIVGMKMALFDVSNVNNPIQISSTVIGDRRTTSSILTNHKALLFSKEKELIAIPVNNYAEDFEITSSSNSTYSSAISSYKNYNKPYISEGYLVYKINLEDGFKLKGTITHSAEKSSYQYYTNSRLLRGLYIENNLYTISEDAIQVNNLDNMEFITKLNLRG